MAPELIEWREFFVTTATVAGALVGLLFVAISVHLRLLSDERSEDLRQDARNILFSYIAAMTLSLFPLIPQALATLGEEILVVFLFIVVATARTVPRLFRSSRVYGRVNRWLRVAWFVAWAAGTVAAGLALVAGQAWPVPVLALGVLLLIVVSVFRTWDIVFRAAGVRRPPGA
ncbi:MAG TPA: hypothetical protein VEU77_09940 [Candidatus Acidoferrales bacterium]|nr:hypothetical protein [Candidatus Acidoferrales bacterium]